MRKIQVFVMAMLAIAAVVPVCAMDTDELVAKAIEAMGGEKAIKEVKSMKTTGKFMASGMEFPFATYHLRPNQMRLEAEVMGAQMIQCYDGEAGWTINPMTGTSEPQKMSPIELKGFKLQADMDGSLIDWKKKGYTIEYIGTDDVEGTETHQLKLDTNDGIVMDMYFDTEYFLLLKVHTKVTEGENEHESDTYMSDYKEIGDLVSAHAIETRIGDQVVNQILLETVELDAEVDKSIFAMPEKQEAAAEE